MSTKPWSAWFDEVLPHVPGCTESIAANAIKNAVIEFCQRSWVLAEFADPVSVNANVAEIDFEDFAPEGYLVVVVLEAFYDERELTFKSPDDLKDKYGSAWQLKTGAPQYLTQLDEESALLVPIPTAGLANALRLRVAYKPSEDATVVEARIFEHYKKVIKSGALAELYQMPKKPWSSGPLFELHTTKFDEGIAKARLKAQKGHGRARRRVTGNFM